jgi:hypothetical protein
LDHALLLWGLPDQAGTRVEFYLRHYVRAANGMVPEQEVSTNASAGPPGSIDLKHWNDECVFADSLADLGRWIELWVDVARAKGARFDLLFFFFFFARGSLFLFWIHTIRDESHRCSWYFGWPSERVS